MLLKPAKVAQQLDMSKSKLYRMVRENKIPHVIIDGCVRIPEKDLIEWIESQKAGITLSGVEREKSPFGRGRKEVN
ncbi:MAG: helix-turn-helix domain-containing protein [Firmicutes bacterium]|nr:helix-turn-helix domain-containing protein [Bacillota bacterium]